MNKIKQFKAEIAVKKMLGEPTLSDMLKEIIASQKSIIDELVDIKARIEITEYRTQGIERQLFEERREKEFGKL